MGRYASERYGSYATAWRRLKRWSEEGIWGKIMESLRDSAYKDDMFSMDIVCVDSTFVETKKGEKILHTTATRERKE
jgi:transposase